MEVRWLGFLLRMHTRQSKNSRVGLAWAPDLHSEWWFTSPQTFLALTPLAGLLCPSNPSCAQIKPSRPRTSADNYRGCIGRSLAVVARRSAAGLQARTQGHNKPTGRPTIHAHTGKLHVFHSFTDVQTYRTLHSHQPAGPTRRTSLVYSCESS